MSRGLFRSHNKVGETMSINTSSALPATFDPVVTKVNDNGRVSWDFGNGSGHTAANSVSHTFPDSTTKTVTLRTNLLSTLTSADFQDDNIEGNLDMSGWGSLFKGNKSFVVSDNSNLTGITHSFTNYKGEMGSNPFTGSTYTAVDCDLTGTLDLRPLGDMGGTIEITGNSNLTEILLSGGTGGFFTINFFNNNLTGNLDLSGFENFAQVFFISIPGAATNVNLTGMTFYTGGSSSLATQFFYGGLPNYVGTMDLSGLKIEGLFYAQLSGYEKIIHGEHNGAWLQYYAYNCNLTGNHDLSMLPTFGGAFLIANNTQLTGITHTASTAVFGDYWASGCDLTGTHDVSMLTGLGGNLRLYDNTSLIGLKLPLITTLPQGLFSVIDLHNCDLGYVNFLPLSGTTFNSDPMYLQDNTLTAGEVNHMLEDFLYLATVGPWWKGITLNIAGDNSPPDTTSGGFDGMAALASLTGSPYNWTVTIS